MKTLSKIPPATQQNEYSCGVAAAQSVLKYFGRTMEHKKLSRFLGANTKEGVHPKALVDLFRAANLSAVVAHYEDLISLSRNKYNAVIVNYQAWKEKTIDYSDVWDSGHYAVLSKIDSKQIWVQDPASPMVGKLAVMTKQDFLDRWHDEVQKQWVNHLVIVIRGVPFPTMTSRTQVQQESKHD